MAQAASVLPDGWCGLGDAAESDFEAEGAEPADVVGDLPAGGGLVVVVVGPRSA
jgi:hypothetical protein